MTPAFTVILPHLSNPGNDQALTIALSCLTENTWSEFYLSLAFTHGDDPLMPLIHQMIVDAPTDTCVLTSSDMFMAPGWDTPLLELHQPGVWVTNILVEPAAISMSGQNKEMDFGRRPETFRRAEFEHWCTTAEARPGEGWVQPIMFSKSEWLAHGSVIAPPLQVDASGFTSADEELLDRWKAGGGRIVRARSYTYHLQRWSQIDEQEHSKRG